MENSFNLCDTIGMSGDTIGGFIRWHRRRERMTQIELADAIGMSNKSVSDWENGRTTPDRDSLTKLAGIFKISLEEFRRFLDIDAQNDAEVLPPEQEEKRQKAVQIINELLADPKKLDQWIDYGDWLRTHRGNQ